MIRSCNDDNDEDTHNVDADEGGLEPGSTRGTTVPCSHKENIHVSESFACINPLYADERNQDKIVRISNKQLGTEENSLPFLE